MKQYTSQQYVGGIDTARISSLIARLIDTDCAVWPPTLMRKVFLKFFYKRLQGEHLKLSHEILNHQTTPHGSQL